MSVKCLSTALSRPRNLVVLSGILSLLLVISSIRQYALLVLVWMDPGHLTHDRSWEQPILLRQSHAGTTVDTLSFKTEEAVKRVVYSEIRMDQSGWVIFQILKAHAYAFSKNATYGGACGDSAHKEDIQQVLSSVGWSEILPLQCPGENGAPDGRVYPSSFFERRHGRRMADKAWRAEIMRHTDYSYFDTMPEKKSPNNKNTTKAVFAIVVHIRRRDVTPCCYPGWYLPNSYFLSMIDHYVQKRAPASDQPLEIQLFSQSESYESWDDLVTQLNTNYRNNYTLHLDGPVGDVWRAILAANVFIGSISEFSRVPALFATGEIPDPRNITISSIAEQTRLQSKALLDQCTETQFVSCKHKWWVKGESNFQK